MRAWLVGHPATIDHLRVLGRVAHDTDHERIVGNLQRRQADVDGRIGPVLAPQVRSRAHAPVPRSLQVRASIGPASGIHRHELK